MHARNAYLVAEAAESSSPARKASVLPMQGTATLRRALCTAALFLVCFFAAFTVPAAGQETRIIVLGDSLSAGFSLPDEDAFPNVLERELRKAGRKVTVVNAGVSGDTASGGLARVDWALGEEADAVIVELGANDMLRGIDPEKTKAALDGIIKRIKAKGMKVLLAGMVAAPGMGKNYENRFNAIYPELAKNHDVAFYPFFLDGVAGNKALNLADGIHPNAQGVRIIVERILPYVERLIDSTTARR